MSIKKKLDPGRYRDNPTAIAGYLTEIFMKNDISILVQAIGNVMRAQNVKALSEGTGLRRENLYGMFAGHRDPSLGNTMKILASFGVQLAVEPLTSIKGETASAKTRSPAISVEREQSKVHNQTRRLYRHEDECDPASFRARYDSAAAFQLRMFSDLRV